MELRSFSPATSTHNGDIVCHQRTPRIVPLTTAKNTNTPYDAAGIHTAKINTAHAAVAPPATSTLPHRSLAHPNAGLPTAVPRFKNAVTPAAFPALNPNASRPYADKLYNNVIYPNILTNAHPSNNATFSRRSSPTSNPRIVARTSAFRPRTSATATRLTAPDAIASMRSAHATPSPGPVAMTRADANDHAMPPMPDPADTMPLASERRAQNHCEVTGAEGR